jgi:paraquat-inducible protein B
VQLVWLIPLVAALVGGWLAIKSVLDRGPVITITFKTAEGLEAGKTKIKYKDVDIGLVESVVLSKDGTGVIVKAELVKEAKSRLVSDTRFWVVRPRISGGSVSGLGTLLSGSYIGADIGKSKEARSEFTGLEVPPAFSTEAPGREFMLRSEDMGSLDIGTPVFFRRLQVGQIASRELNKDGEGVTLKVFVNAPYDQYVNANTRFWHASGFDVSLDSSGIKVDTQSLVSIVLGGLAFQTPADAEVMPPAEPNAVFTLYLNRIEAMKHPDLIADRYTMVFKESVRGLVPGAAVDFRGIVVGEVVSIKTRIDRAKGAISLPVEINFYPERFTSREVGGAKTGRAARDPRAMANMLVASGLRGQIRTGNLLTGQLYIALDIFPKAPKAQIDWSANPPELPTIPGSLDDLRTGVTNIVSKLEKMNFEAIGAGLQQALESADKLMKRVDTELTPEARAMLEDARRALVSAERAIGSADRVLAPDAPLQQDTRAAMVEIGRAAQAFRILADYLERHPEALISGKKEEKK